MGELAGVLAAMLSSCLGGSAIAVTRFVVGSSDPMTLGACRFGIGALVLLPVAIAQRQPWPKLADALPVVGLGLLIFGLFPILFNLSISWTTAAHAALAFSTLPLITMLIAAFLGIERLTGRKLVGVLLAMAGVTMAMLAGLQHAPPGFWKGDLIMVAGSACMSLYNVWSRPYIQRSSPITFTVVGMLVGSALLAAISLWRGGFRLLAEMDSVQLAAIGWLGIGGGAAAFFLWVYALGRTTPTRTAIAAMVNPIVAGTLGAVLLGEPLPLSFAIGLVLVFTGIWIAVTTRPVPIPTPP